jgi:hypothetical protein
LEQISRDKWVEPKNPCRSFPLCWKLRGELNDPELITLFHVANSLCQNSYEGNQSPEFVISGAEAVKRPVAKLEKLAR